MSDSQADAAGRFGEVLANKYRLVRRLDKGGMATVWEARHVAIDRRFAVKFLLPELAAREDIRRRFEREAKAAAAIESEHVVGVFDYGVTDAGEPFIVMEYLEGDDLAEVVEREGQLAAFRAADIVVQAARGVERAHQRGIVHRDLKPQNLFLVRREDGTELCKVLDFGVAKVAAARSGISKSGALIGTLHYMSPEQLRGDADVDGRTDVYSLGCVLYECLAGRRPYDAEQPHVVMHRILEMDAPRLESLRAGLPRGLPELVHRALHKDPKARFQSVMEFQRALLPFAQRGTAIRAEQPSGSAPTVPDGAFLVSQHGRPAAAKVFGVVVFAVAVLLTALWSTRKPPGSMVTTASSAAGALVATVPRTLATPAQPPAQGPPRSTAAPTSVASAAVEREAVRKRAQGRPMSRTVRSVPKGERQASEEPPAAAKKSPAFDLTTDPYSNDP